MLDVVRVFEAKVPILSEVVGVKLVVRDIVPVFVPEIVCD